MSERYRLVSKYPVVIVDLVKAKNSGYNEKYEYVLNTYDGMGSEKDDARFYNAEDLVELLNEYADATGDNPEDATASVNFDELMKKLKYEIKFRLNTISLFETEKFKLQWVNMDFNNRDFEKYSIDVKISRTNDSGFIREDDEGPVSKSIDGYTLKKVLLLLAKFENSPNLTEENEMLLFLLKTELLTLDSQRRIYE